MARRRGSANLLIQLFLGIIITAVGWMFAVYLYEWLIDRMVPGLEQALNVTLWPEFSDVSQRIHQLLYFYPYIMLFALVFSLIGIALRYSTQPYPQYV